MPRFAANLSMMFNEVPFLERFEAAARAGFKGVELLFPYEHPAKEVAARLEGAGLVQTLFNVPPGDFTKGERGIGGIPGREAELETGIATALRYAEALGCPRLHVMAGLTQHGANRPTYVANLRKAARLAAKQGVTLLIEPINGRDIPGYLVNRTSDALAVIAMVGEPNVGLQLDLYHRQIVEGDLSAAIREYGAIAAHMQLANPPDRGEPDAGEIDYAHAFKEIDASGFKGWIGCEYRPRGDTLAGLKWVGRLGQRLGA
jgi:hydroxypyruvate isomerase